MRNYQRTKTNVVIAIAVPVVVDIGKTTVVRVTTDQAVIVLESMLVFF